MKYWCVFVFQTSIIEYVKPSDMKKELNEKFSERFPHAQITLSKLRSIKLEMRRIGLDCSIDTVTIAQVGYYIISNFFKNDKLRFSGLCILWEACPKEHYQQSEQKVLCRSKFDQSVTAARACLYCKPNDFWRRRGTRQNDRLGHNADFRCMFRFFQWAFLQREVQVSFWVVSSLLSFVVCRLQKIFFPGRWTGQKSAKRFDSKGEMYDTCD